MCTWYLLCLSCYTVVLCFLLNILSKIICISMNYVLCFTMWSDLGLAVHYVWNNDKNPSLGCIHWDHTYKILKNAIFWSICITCCTESLASLIFCNLQPLIKEKIRCLDDTTWYCLWVATILSFINICLHNWPLEWNKKQGMRDDNCEYFETTDQRIFCIKCGEG